MYGVKRRKNWSRFLAVLMVLIMAVGVLPFGSMGTGMAQAQESGDSIAPAVSSKTPAPDTTGVALDAEVSVTFDEAIFPGDQISVISITYGAGETVSGVTYNINGSQLKINHASFTPGIFYTVTIPAGAVKDSAGNATAGAITWSFTTKDPSAAGSIQNPSFELPGTNGVNPTSWSTVYLENETSPHNLNTWIFNASGQYPPPPPIPNGDFAVEVFYQVGSNSGLIGAGLEQNDEVFGTIDGTKENILRYDVVQTYYPSPESASWGGAVAEVEFESAGRTYKLRYFHKFSADYSSQPQDQDYVKYVISTPFEGNGTWMLGVEQHLNEDILNKFGLSDFTIKAIRITNLVNKTAASPYPNSTTYWDNVRIERAGEDTQPPSISEVAFSDPKEVGKDLAVAAQVTDNYHVGSVKLFYKMEGDADFAETDMVAAGGNEYGCIIPGASVKAGAMTYYIEAEDGQQNSGRYPAEGEATVTISGDQSPPVVSGMIPAAGTTIFSKRPDISAGYSDPSGIDPASVKLYIKHGDGEYSDVTASSTITASRVTYKRQEDLAEGLYTVKVELTDNTGKSTSEEWSFRVAAAMDLQHFAGTTHNHTKISHDATGELAAAISAAKAHDYDWFIFSDHSHDIDPGLSDSVDPDGDGLRERTGGTEWQSTKQVADQNTVDGQFVAFAGHEMTSTTWGHANIWGTENFIDRMQESGKYQTLDNMYSWVQSHPEAVGQFNHPFGGEFNQFAYDSEADEVFNLIEVGNGSGHYSYSNFEQRYWEVLDKGWHVAPVYGEDNHDATWGQVTKRTIVLATELTRDALLDAMRNLRVYMSEDDNFRLDVWANGETMGARLSENDISFEITGNDPNANDEITQVAIITNTGKVIESTDPQGASFTWNPTIEGSGSHWYVIKVTQADGQRIYSAPVWTPGSEIAVRLSGLTLSADSAVTEQEITVSAAVNNAGTVSMTDLVVDFYKDSVAAENKIGTTNIAALEAGQTETASINWTPQQAGTFSIIAALTAAGDPDISDNQAAAALEVTEPLGKMVMIDYGHGNDYASATSYKDLLKKLEQQLRAAGYTVVRNGGPEQDDPLTAAELENMDVLIITQPSAEKDLTAEEHTTVADFVKAGGSLFYAGKGSHENDPTIANDLLAAVETNIRINYDDIYDEEAYYQGENSPWAVLAGNLPVRDTALNMLRDKVNEVRYYSGASLTDGNMQALTVDDGVEILLKANATSYQTDQAGYMNESTYVYTNPADMPLVAVEDLAADSGKIAVAGRGFFSDYEYGAGSGNETLAINIIDWLAGSEAKTENIAEVRKQSDGTPAVIRGTVASDAGIFYDAFYVQDETGGIMAFKNVPDDADLKTGDIVRVYGKVKSFEGNLELEFEDFARDVVKTGVGIPPAPKEVLTGTATIDENQGLLVKVQGLLTRWYDQRSFYVDDGSGEALVFTDGYIVEKTGPLPELNVGDTVSAIGFAGKFADGERIRVRNTAEIVKAAGGGGKPFAITEGQLDRNSGIKATVNVNRTGATNHQGEEVVIFQLMAGKTPVSIVALQKDIQQTEKLIAHFNKTGDEFWVKTFVFDKFNSDPGSVQNNLAEAQVLE